MTVTFVTPSLNERACTPLDPEVRIITHLFQAAAEVGLQTDPVSIVNLYMALDLDGEFLSSCIRDEGMARLKLLRIFGDASSLRPVLQIADLLRTTTAPAPDSAIGAAVIYLASAWSKQGVGLFDRATTRNAAVATDLAIAQTILPHVGPTLRSRPGLQETVKQALKSYPHSLVALEEMNR